MRLIIIILLLNYSFFKGDAQILFKAELFFIEEKFEEAIFEYKIALDSLNRDLSHDNDYFITLALRDISTCYISLNQLDSSIVYGEKLIKFYLSKKIKPDLTLFNTIFISAYNYYKLGNYMQSFELVNIYFDEKNYKYLNSEQRTYLAGLTRILSPKISEKSFRIDLEYLEKITRDLSNLPNSEYLVLYLNGILIKKGIDINNKNNVALHMSELLRVGKGLIDYDLETIMSVYLDLVFYSEKHQFYFNIISGDIISTLKDKTKELSVLNFYHFCIKTYLKYEKYSDANVLLDESLNKLLPNNEKFIDVYDNLINDKFLYLLRVGLFKSAESLYDNYIRSCYNKCFWIKMNYATYLSKIGSYSKSLQLLHSIQKNYILGSDTLIDCAFLPMLYSSIGNVSLSLGDINQSIDAFSMALKYNNNCPDYLNSNKYELYNNIGLLYSQINNFEESEFYFLKGLSLLNDNKLGETTTAFILYQNLAEIYRRQGKMDIAKKQFSLALPIIDNVFNIDKISFYTNYGTLFDSSLEIDSAFKYFMKAEHLIDKVIKEEFNFMSEQEKTILYFNLNFNLDVIRNFIFLSKSKNNELLYNFELKYKGFLFRNIRELKNSKIQSISSANDLDSNESNNYRLSVIPKVTDLSKNLKLNEVVIEFISFQYRKNNIWTDSILYLALLLRPHEVQPTIIALFEERQLDSILNRTILRESSYINKIYSDGNLYDLIWKPLESYIPKGSYIYFAPSGILNKINLGAIATSNSTYLSDEYQFSQVSTTAVIASTIKEEKSVKDIAIFGGIEFDAKEDEITTVIAHISKDQDYVSRGLYTADSTRAGKWTFLNGTLQEAKNIDALARENKVVSQFYTGVDAVEENFKNLTGKASPSVLHIATHGFFFPDPKLDKQKLNMNSFQEENAFTIADNPLNRSGLLFAGSNRAWVGDTISTTREDGILTAYEASNTSLPNTQLVVLSACETGLGDIKGSEGVYGLQRAFKMAGAQYLMMSLWKVPDQATKEFMTAFYTELFTNKQSIRTSYNLAQSAMKIKYRNEPYKWGGFVLIE